MSAAEGSGEGWIVLLGSGCLDLEVESAWRRIVALCARPGHTLKARGVELGFLIFRVREISTVKGSGLGVSLCWVHDGPWRQYPWRRTLETQLGWLDVDGHGDRSGVGGGLAVGKRRLWSGRFRGWSVWCNSEVRGGCDCEEKLTSN